MSVSSYPVRLAATVISLVLWANSRALTEKHQYPESKSQACDAVAEDSFSLLEMSNPHTSA